MKESVKLGEKFLVAELFSINKVSLIQVSFCINTELIRDDPYWTLGKRIQNL